MRAKAPARRLSWLERRELRTCASRTVDGLWLGAKDGDSATLLGRVEGALALIREHDPHRYRLLKRHLERIWVRLLYGSSAAYLSAANACQLDSRYVADPGVALEDIAASIVHEMTHARIDRWVPYEEGLRQRIETLCRREELRLAKRLPDGAALARRTEEWLAAPPEPEFWSDAAMNERRVEGSFEVLRHLGLSERWLSLLRRINQFVSARRKRLKGAPSG